MPAKCLNRISANNVDVEPGRIVYTQWCNERGGIEADLTVTRLEENKFLVVTGAVPQVRDMAWLKRHTPDDAHCICHRHHLRPADDCGDGAKLPRPAPETVGC